TPDQLAAAQLAMGRMQLIITGLAIFLGPIVGVIGTVIFQRMSERRRARHALFMLLLGTRKGPIPGETARALNTIDVVFYRNRTVVQLWHEYYEMLSQPSPTEAQNHKWLDLLTAMGRDLG